MLYIYYSILILLQNSACLAEPYLLLYTGSPVPIAATPPPDVDTNEEVLVYIYTKTVT
jgi:hypothetical protein